MASSSGGPRFGCTIVCVSTRRVSAYRSTISRAAAMSAFVRTFSAARPGGDVSSATDVSLPPNTQAAHSAADRRDGSTPAPHRSGSTMRKNAKSASAPVVAARLGRTRCVWTSITGWPSPPNAASAAAASVSAACGTA